MLIGIVIALVAIILYVISTYNFFVTSKARIKASIQEIGNQLKRQAELIPNLEESAKGYLKHEKDLFKMLTDARKAVSGAVESGNIEDITKAGDKVAQLIPQLRIAVESNPDIKGADVVTRLMDELRDTADKIMYARRTLIDLTADYNVKIVTFPTNIVANMFHFTAEKGLETPDSGTHLSVSSSETSTPKIKLN